MQNYYLFVALSGNMSREWNDVLAVKVSYWKCILVGLELPYCKNKKMLHYYKIYSILFHMMSTLIRSYNLMKLYVPSHQINLANISYIVAIFISELVPLLAIAENLFISRKYLKQYRTEISGLTYDLQKYFGQKINFYTHWLAFKYFLPQPLIVWMLTNFPFLSLRMSTWNTSFGALFLAISYWILMELPLRAFLEVWRINCLSKHLNKQFRKKFTYDLEEHDLNKVVEYIKRLVHLINLLCKTMRLTMCCLIVVINMFIIDGMRNLLSTSVYDKMATLWVMCNIGLVFGMIVLFAKTADETILSLKESAKISYKLYLTYPVMGDYRRRDKLLWMSRGPITFNVTFSMLGIFEIALSCNMSREWKDVLAVKVSYWKCIFVGLELPYCKNKKLLHYYKIYSILLHTVSTVIMSYNLIKSHMLSHQNNLDDISYLVALLTSEFVPLLAIAENLFTSRKCLEQYRTEIVGFTCNLQEYFGQKINFHTSSLAFKYFLAQPLIVWMLTNYPFLSMKMDTWKTCLVVLFVAIRYLILMELPLRAFLEVWRINCLTKHLNKQFRKNFTHDLKEYDLNKVVEYMKRLVHLIKLLCKTMGLTICCLIVVINMFIIHGMRNLLSSFSLNIYKKTFLWIMCDIGLIFGMIVLLAKTADETILNLKESAKISYKLYLTYPVMKDCKRKDMLLWISRGPITSNVTFSMLGIFEIGWPLILKTLEICLTYLLFLMQYNN